ncbi:MAG: serine/threonine protein kinase [Planctomycetes bacterium]|nr:serine/threonine protein kinase [Planctomycetota bacterium]
MNDERSTVEFDTVAEAFLEAVRNGDEPSIEDWAARHPELAESIRELFPTILAMEEMKRVRDAEPARAALGPNDRLGDYRIVRQIGRGGMGVVYEAVQESLGRRVAVKVLPAIGDVRRVRRFEREARTAARLHHTNIVPIFGVGEQDGWHYYVMQVIRGVGLDAVIAWLRDEAEGRPAPAVDAPPAAASADATAEAQASPSASGSDVLTIGQAVRALRTGAFRPPQQPSAASTESGSSDAIPAEPAPVALGELPRDPGPPQEPRARYWRSVAWIGRQVASALAHAHAQGVLHRDIKPANLLLDARGVVWVTDFGLATAVGVEGLTRTGDLLGTLQYMAPEQLAGQQDERSDVYALGLTLYELLTLRTAFREEDRGRLLESIARGVIVAPSQVRPGIPRDLETIVLHALQREPRHRYASAAELAADLQNFLDDRPITARRANWLEHGWRWCRRNRAVASLAAIALLSLVVAAITGWVGWASTKAALGRERRAVIAEREARAEALARATEAAAARDAAERARERSDENLRLAMQAFEEIFESVAGPLGGPSTLKLVSGESDSGTSQGEDVGYEWDVVSYSVSEADATLLERLLEFYEELATRNADVPGLAAETARVTRRVGDIQLRLGRVDDAIVSYSRALQLLERDGDAADPVAIGALRNDLGRAYLRVGRHALARLSHSAVLELLDADDSASARYECARAHEMLGGIGPQAGLGPPGGRLLPGGRLGAGPPGGQVPPEDIAAGARPPGGGPPPEAGPPGGRPVLRRLRDLATGAPAEERGIRRAFEEFAKAQEIDRELADEHPDNPKYLLAASRTARRVVQVAPPEERIVAWLRLREAARAIAGLVQRAPDTPQYLAEQAELDLMVPQLRTHATDDSGLRSIREGVEIAARLEREHPAVPEFAALHRRALGRLAGWLIADGMEARRRGDEADFVQRAREARDALRSALGQLERTASAANIDEQRELLALQLRCLILDLQLGEQDVDPKAVLEACRQRFEELQLGPRERRELLRGAGDLLRVLREIGGMRNAEIVEQFLERSVEGR